MINKIKNIEYVQDQDEAKIITTDNEVFNIKLSKAKVVLKEIIDAVEDGITERISYGFRNYKKEFAGDRKTDSKKLLEILPEIVRNKDYLGQVGFMVLYSFFSDAIDKALRQDDIFDAILNIKFEYKERKLIFIKMLKTMEFTSVEKVKIINYISLENYFSEIIKNLIREDTSAPNEFSWIKYPYVKIEGNECKVRFFQNDITYGREYVGLFNNFVTHTQSERFFLSISTCIINQRSSIIYGLNESNKKESFKIFSKLLGHYPFFIKCNSLLDTKGFTNIKYAVQKRGNWLIVDEFEKLSVEQISVISEEISAIYRAFHDSESVPLEKRIQIHPNTQIFCFYNIERKFKPHPMVKNAFRLVGVTSPEIGIFIQLSLRNIRIPNYKNIDGKILYVLEYLNSKIESIQNKSRRQVLIYFKLFMKCLNLEMVKVNKISDDYEVIRNCLEMTFVTKFYDSDFVEVKKFIRSIFILEAEAKEMEREKEERALNKKTTVLQKEKKKDKEVKLDRISQAVEDIGKLHSFNHNNAYKTKIQNVSLLFKFKLYIFTYIFNLILF